MAIPDPEKMFELDVFSVKDRYIGKLSLIAATAPFSITDLLTSEVSVKGEKLPSPILLTQDYARL